MMLISFWNHEHVYVYQSRLGRFHSFSLRVMFLCPLVLGCVTDTLDLTETYLFQGRSCWVCVIVELMYISYDELSVHGALFVNVLAKHCLSYIHQFTDLVIYLLSTRG